MYLHAYYTNNAYIKYLQYLYLRMPYIACIIYPITLKYQERIIYIDLAKPKRGAPLLFVCLFVCLLLALINL